MNRISFPKIFPQIFSLLTAIRVLCLIAIASNVAFAQTQQQVVSSDINQKPTAAALEAAFAEQEAAAKALKIHTQEKADALLKASQLASDIAWQLFEAKRSTDAATWFARSSEVKAESYQHGRAYWKSSLDTEVDAHEKTLAKRIADLQSELLKTTDAEERKEMQVRIGVWTRIRLYQRYNAITMLETLARDHDDFATYLEYALQELQVRREQLADLESVFAPAAELAVKKSELAKAYERVAYGRDNLAFFAEAQKNYEQALAIRRSLPETLPERELHETYSALASMFYYKIGDYVKAREYYELALKDFTANSELRSKSIEAEKSSDNKDMRRVTAMLSEANCLANLGSVSQELGDYRLAKEYLERALKVSQSLPKGGYLNLAEWAGSVMRARVLSEFAGLHAANGETAAATKILEEVITIKRAIGNDQSTASTLMQAAHLQNTLGDIESARRNTTQARQIFQQTQKLQSVISSGGMLSSLAREAGDLTEAAARAEEIMPLARRSGSAYMLSGALRTLAAVRLEQKRLAEAGTLLEEAAAHDGRVGSVLDRINTLQWQGRVLEAQNQNEAAIAKYKQATGLLEGVRATSTSESFGEVQSNSKIYERLVLLLIKAGRGEEAFDTMSRARSKKLKDDLRLTSLKTGDTALQELLDKASTLETKLQTVRGQLEMEQAKSAAARDNSKVQNLRNLVASTQGEYFAVSQQIRAKNENYDKVFSASPKQLAASQRAIPDDVAWIQYAPMKNDFYIFVITKTALKIFAPPVTKEEVDRRIRAVRRQIARPATNPVSTRGAALAPVSGEDKTSLRDNLVALHKMLIAPIEEAVADKSTLIFIPTQLLYYLPMQALAHEENGQLKYLIEEKKIGYLSGADVTRVVQAPDEARFKAGLIAFGDPTGAELPAARDEVQQISKIFPEGKAMVGESVTKSAVTDASTLGQRYVHFATHGILKANAPTQSYIQLANAVSSDQAQLTVGEVWSLPLGKVDLVSLSACQTALGEDEPDGGEITTLAEAFSSAGAPTVVASLWSVADESTREWMVEFYTQLAAGQSKTAAYQSAQLKLLRTSEYSHPYYWAPFVLMGDWR